MRFLASAALALALALFPVSAPAKSLDGFARCLRDHGATFYGASWCPHCARQRELFGPAERYLRYVECAAEDAGGVTPACKRAAVKTYPTWVFNDGTRTTGRQSLDELAARTGCALPD